MTQLPEGLKNQNAILVKKEPENIFSQENITKKSLESARNPNIKEMISKHIPELKIDINKKTEELKIILEGKENIGKDIEKNKIIDGVLEESYGEYYKNAVKNSQSKIDLREKYLLNNKNILDKKLVDNNGNEIEKTKYDEILSKNENFSKLDTKNNSEFTKELLTVYGEKIINSYDGLIGEAGKRGKKLPETLEEFDKFIDNQFEYVVSPDNSKKSDLKEDYEKYKKISEADSDNSKARIIFELLVLLFRNSPGEEINYTSNNGGDLPEGLDKMSPGVEKVLKVAMSQIGNNEMDGSADKYLQEIGHKNRKSAGNENAWCAAFVNWSLMKGGMDFNSSLASQSFIKGSGKGHVGFKVGNQLLGGNQSNKVSLKPLKLNKVKGWIMPDNQSEIHRIGDSNFKNIKIPDGAIIVFGSSKNTR